MRIFEGLLMLFVATFVATTASALITVAHIIQDPVGALYDDSFEVEVWVGYDGDPTGLTGVFLSAQWDPSKLSFLGSSFTQPFILFPGPDGFLTKVVDAGQSFPGDPAGTVRTVQYQALPNQWASGSAFDVHVTTLIFERTGSGVDPLTGEFSATIDPVFNTGDGIFAFPAQLGPSDYSLTGTGVYVIPEPGSVLLMGLGLAGLASRRRALS